MTTGKNKQNALARLKESKVVSLQTFIFGMDTGEHCGETYVRYRDSGNPKCYFLTTTRLPRARNIATTNLYLVPLSQLKQEHEKLPLSDFPKWISTIRQNLLTQPEK